MYVICQQAHRQHESQMTQPTVFGSAIDAFTGEEGGDKQSKHQQCSWHSLLSQRSYVLAVGVAQVAIVGADNRHHLRLLIWAIDELVGSGAYACDGMLAPHAEGGVPAVETLQV